MDEKKSFFQSSLYTSRKLLRTRYVMAFCIFFFFFSVFCVAKSEKRTFFHLDAGFEWYIKAIKAYCSAPLCNVYMLAARVICFILYEIFSYSMRHNFAMPQSTFISNVWTRVKFFSSFLWL